MEQAHESQPDGIVQDAAELERLRQLQKQIVRQKIGIIIEKNRVMRNDWDRF